MFSLAVPFLTSATGRLHWLAQSDWALNLKLSQHSTPIFCVCKRCVVSIMYATVTFLVLPDTSSSYLILTVQRWMGRLSSMIVALPRHRADRVTARRGGLPNSTQFGPCDNVGLELTRDHDADIETTP